MAGVRRLLRDLSNVQERVERTPVGQGVISGLIVVVVLTGVVWNLPASTIKRQTMTVVYPIGIATGLGQSWEVFAPNPPRQNDHLEVVVTLAGGRDVVWNLPHGDPVVGHYSTERWHKLREYLMKTPSLRQTFARWVAEDVAGRQGDAVRVRIVVRSVTLPPPGSADVARTTVQVLYDETLAGHP
jgi:hypothetical protein